MKKKGSNTKIRKHMRRLSQRESGEWYMHTVRRLVDARPDKMHTIRSVADLLAASDTDHGERSETFKQTRSALYNLAADDRIAFVSRSFHAWDLGDEMKNTRCVFYGKSTPYRAPILSAWLCDDEEIEDDAIVRIDAEIDKRRKEIDTLVDSKCEILRSLFDAHKEAFLKLAKKEQ